MEQALVHTPPQARASLARAESIRILLVAGDADLRGYIGRVLRRWWNVEDVANGAEALDVIRTRRPTLVVADAAVPAVGGVTLINALEADPATRSIPLIVLSDGTEMGNQLSREPGSELQKPFSSRELVAAVWGRLDQKLGGPGRARRRDDRVRSGSAQPKNPAAIRDQFVAALGHELRNPLSVIVTGLQLMRAKGVTCHEIDVIERQVGTITRLVDDLLDVARLDQGLIALEREPVDIGAVVSHAVETVQPLLHARQNRLTLRLEDGLCISVDRIRMAQVVANLLANAAKYSESGSEITVRAVQSDRRLHVSVEDHGIGIATDMLPHVFDAFSQARDAVGRSCGGLGLGLAIVKNIVELHEGTVAVTSDGPGTGSTFCIDLPIQ